MDQDENATLYCDLLLTTAEATALLQLVSTLRVQGQHQVLERVFNDVVENIEMSRRINSGERPWRKAER
jgi:hypothetical protein